MSSVDIKFTEGSEESYTSLLVAMVRGRLRRFANDCHRNSMYQYLLMQMRSHGTFAQKMWRVLL